jgi:hypothetical protein
MVRIMPFLKKEVAEKEAAKKEAVEKEAAKKEAIEKEDDEEEEDQQAYPSESSDDDCSVSLIRFPIVMHWSKCPICLNHMYQQLNSLFFHIKYFITDELSMPNVVE